MGLGTGLISGKAVLSSLDKPKFIEALILKILCKPSEIDGVSDSLFLLLV